MSDFDLNYICDNQSDILCDRAKKEKKKQLQERKNCPLFACWQQELKKFHSYPLSLRLPQYFQSDISRGSAIDFHGGKFRLFFFFLFLWKGGRIKFYPSLTPRPLHNSPNVFPSC
jgi:hypothetical protein